MKLTKHQYTKLLANKAVPTVLQKELTSKAIEERWSFVGT